MPKIFISYRRDDNIYAVNYIFTAMANQYGRRNIFFDVDTIPLGVDFREYLDEKISQCDVLLAVIGDKWLPILSARREDPSDYVRAEIEAALRRDIPVVPILVDKAALPTEEVLTEDIRALAMRNATEVRGGKHLDDHLMRLVKQVDFLLQGDGYKQIQPIVYDSHGRPFSTDGNIIDDDLLQTLAMRNVPAFGVDGPLSLNFMGEQGFSDEDLRQIRKLDNVQNLRLDDTYISDEGLRYLHGFSNLEKLYLNGTDIGDAGLENLKPLTSLIELNLCGTKISDLGLRHLGLLTQLEYLDLSATEINGVGLPHLKSLISLSCLDLSSTEIINPGQYLPELSSLRELDISYTEFRDPTMIIVTKLPNLKSLRLAKTNITDADLKLLRKLEHLQVLDISDTEISDDGLRQLQFLVNLKEININDTKITAKGRKLLKEALPSTRILRE